MKKSVTRAAQKFIKQTLKGKNDIGSVTTYLHSIGYTISMYSNEDEDKLIIKHDLDSQVKTVHAFTVVENYSKIIYINDSLSAENKTYSILHETGHIVLGHLDSDDFVFNKRLREMEAETFAYTVLNPPKANRLSVFLWTVIIILLVTHLIPSQTKDTTSPTPSTKQTPPTIETSVEPVESEYVFVTSTGEKYHRDGCRYIKDKNCTQLIEAEAQKNHDPCSVCNP